MNALEEQKTVRVEKVKIDMKSRNRLSDVVCNRDLNGLSTDHVCITAPSLRDINTSEAKNRIRRKLRDDLGYRCHRLPAGGR